VLSDKLFPSALGKATFVKGPMKMFNLISIGERAGNGVPNIYKIWAEENYVVPVIEEIFNPDRMKLTLPFVKNKR